MRPEAVIPVRMNAARNIVLIGLRGSGKTTVGRALAGQLRRPFVDCDDVIERAAGLSVTEIFKQYGEDHFRALESTSLAECLGRPGAVISVGGGAVLRDENRRHMQPAICIWLDAVSEVLALRLRADARSASLRPALTALEPRAELESQRTARGPYYKSLAALRVETDGKSISQVVAEIVARLGPEAAAP